MESGLVSSQREYSFLINYTLEINYVGSKFQGWQTQLSGLAVQDHLNKAIKTLTGNEVRTIGASRTDTGVHAHKQIVLLQSEGELDSMRFLKGVNALVDSDIGVRSLKKVSENFHPIFSSTGKAYCYRIWNSPLRNPFLKPFVWQIPYALNRESMVADLNAFVGEHDFSSFCNVGSEVKSKVRKIFEVSLQQKGHLTELWFLGSGFLKQMIRIIVGTIIDGAGKEKRSLTIEEIIKAKSRDAAGITAPAQGLSLVDIFYDQVPKLSTIIHNADALGFAL